MAKTVFVPIPCKWMPVDVFEPDGSVERRMALVPNRRWDKVANKQFREDEEHPIAVLEPRNRKSHDGYFAAIAKGFDNVPEEYAERWKSPEHLRHWVLIETGWFDEAEYDAADWGIKGERAIKQWQKQMAVVLRKADEFCRIFPSGSKLIVRSAKSQSGQAMDAHTFEASKRDVLEWVEAMEGLPKGTLIKEAKDTR